MNRKFKLTIILLLLILFSNCNKDEIEPELVIYKVTTVPYFLSSESDIIGETIALSGETPNYLLRNDAKIQKVYKLNENGITVFRVGKDYIVLPEGGLQRTANSSIPDFSFHKTIVDNNGKFSFTPDPNRNPQLSELWQVMVDYKTKLDVIIQAKGNAFANGLKQKIESKEDVFIQSIGTSITAGAHTLPYVFGKSDSATYIQLIAKAINKLYGNKVKVENLAVGGADISTLFIPKLNYLLTQETKPDILFIEFGMNEHFDLSDMNWRLDELEADIKKLSIAGINCALIGFFQQNPSWNIENEKYTVYFNSRLKEIATRNNIYFSDIYSLFDNIPKEKMYRDLMADYMHHPTDFGHKLYYISTVPIVLFNDKNESDLLKLIN